MNDANSRQSFHADVSEVIFLNVVIILVHVHSNHDECYVCVTFN